MDTRPYIRVTPFTLEERNGWIHPVLSDFLVEHCHDSERFRVKVGRCHNAKPHEVARTVAVQTFFDEQEPYTHLLMIDNDILPGYLDGRNSNLLELALCEKDVIAAPCPIAGVEKNTLNVFMATDDRLIVRTVNAEEMQRAAAAGGLLQVDYVGFGAVMIARRVLQALTWPFCAEPTIANLAEEAERIRLGKPLGEDIRFCENARKAGFEIWAHYQYLSGHSRESNLLQQFITRAEFEKALEAGGGRKGPSRPLSVQPKFPSEVKGPGLSY